MMNPEAQGRLKEVLIGEALLFEVLGKALQFEPEKLWLQSLIDEDVFSELPIDSNNPDLISGLKDLQTWSDANRNGNLENTLIELKTDYTRLFIGLGKPFAPPWESVYFNEERMVFQEQTIQVRNWYQRFGLQSEKLFEEPDDHIGLELAFITYLAKMALQALEENRNVDVVSYLHAWYQFMSQHPLQWSKVWMDQVHKNARTDFYRGLAHLTHGALLAATETLQIMLSKEVAL